jgi:hypothetical protein
VALPGAAISSSQNTAGSYSGPRKPTGSARVQEVEAPSFSLVGYSETFEP